ncbi:helix-turn-helix transcriptional regulator [Danxiaibacter flavus]|uniref:Helix-turn-helix transcriptional regulator n=1 Tax=Danxiaibacter flavus TaxID=3049108 RepID=A0ABV3ZN94_9BACT|nr:helix-turn-helix transcriptional regulator [Chitinophagaceae bacterium DXS]
MKLKNFKERIDSVSDLKKLEISFNMDILERLQELLDAKFEGNQSLLAKKMNVSEAVVSKWFNGVQNFTTQTLLKFQLAFGEPIAVVCTDKPSSEFRTVKMSHEVLSKTIIVSVEGGMTEEIKFKKNKVSNELHGESSGV